MDKILHEYFAERDQRDTTCDERHDMISHTLYTALYRTAPVLDWIAALFHEAV